ncbi:MAG: DNA polymerase III subunit gamma/tau [Rhodoferax sp.]|nr:DNA polymerase III subunit gamma/tau [Rhodoferax sp.]
MSYLVLARKYRPRNFAEMVGQDHVVQALSNALTTQRLHHAYLFTGTRGVGKTTVSRILAKSLNCQGVDGQGGITATPCGVCQACTDIDSGRFVDYTELDAASNRGIDDVQTLLEQAVYKPVQGRFKVFMIDEVHMLTGPAFNAMLKTLEEPPDYLKFVLATTDPQKVPVTVLSRCLQFNLRPMAPETIREHLIQVLGQEAVASDPQALRLLARAARGSMRDALSLTDQAIAFGAGALSEATVRTMLGSVDRSYVFRLIEALALGDGRTVVQTVDTLRLNGLSAASTLEEMATVLQRMAVLQTMGPAPTDGDDDSDTEAQDTARLAATLPADETQLLYSICLHGRGDLGLAPDEYAALTMVLLRLLAFKPPVPQGERVPAASNAPLVEKKTLNSGPTGAAAPLQRPASADSARVVQAPVGAPRTVQPWEDPPAAPDLPVQVPSEPPPHAASTPRIPVPAQALGSAAKPVAVAAAVYSQSGAVPPGHILPVRAATGGGDAHEGVDGGDEGDDSALAVPRRPAPIDHRVVGVPVRQQTECRADANAAAHATPVLIPTEEGDFWHATVQSLVDAQAIGAMVRELALQAQLVARDEGQWLLRVERESLNQAGSRDRLALALKDAGFDVALAVEVGRVTDSPSRRNASASAERQVAAEQLIYATPLVQHLMRDFGAKVVPGSIRPL